MTGFDGDSVLTIALILLVLAAIWAVVELALTFRKTRASVKEVSDNLNETINQVNPVVDKLDGMVDDLDPAIKQADPLMTRVNTAVDALTVDLVHVDDVLADVSKVTNTGATVSTAVTNGVTKAVGNIGNAAADVAARLAGKQPGEDEHSRLAEPAPEPASAEPASDEHENDGYFTYGEKPEEKPSEEQAPETPAGEAAPSDKAE